MNNKETIKKLDDYFRFLHKKGANKPVLEKIKIYFKDDINLYTAIMFAGNLLIQSGAVEEIQNDD